MQTENRFSLLFRKYVDRLETEAERQEFLLMIQEEGYAGALQDLVDAEMLKVPIEERLSLDEQQEVLNNILVVEPKEIQPLMRRGLWPRISVAAGVAAAVATIAFGVWFFSYREDASSLAPRNDDWAMNDVAPGRNGATITLSTGQVIALSGEKKGVVIDPTSMTYDDGSEIASQARNDGQGGNSQGPSSGLNPSLRGTKQSPVEMTASTAKGQTYEFTLPDGTHVWLNADSKISFPSQFSGKERKILLEGEAYFAVVHRAKQPFRVESRGSEGQRQVVEDIGTEFNINAYPDEGSIKTTLVEGEALVSSGLGMTKSLKPGEQVQNQNNQLNKQNVDAESISDWKNGVFSFEDESMPAIMRKISRWYNVEVIYKGTASEQEKFSGTADRSANISVVLKTLAEMSNLKFKVEQRKVIVYK